MSSSEVKSLQGKKAAAVRWASPNAGEVARDLAAAKIAAYIERVVSAAPPLTNDQRARLTALLSGSGARV